MQIKKLLASCALAAAAAATAIPFAACNEGGADNADKVVSEAIAHTEWGYAVEMLYQEYGDGSVTIYEACYMEGQADAKIVYEGNVVKGTDSDGDPLVTLTITSATSYTAEGSADAMDIAVTNATQTTNTYDTATGDYTIAFEFSLFGYTTLTVNFEVASTDSPTDAETWLSQYIEV